MSPRPDYAMRAWPKQESPDLTGQRFGLVVVLRMAPGTGYGARCFVHCDCGKDRYIQAASLKANPPRTHRACNRKPAE